MRKLIIIRGNSGSGKTTLANKLQKRFGRNTMVISQDMMRMQVLNAKDTEALPLIMNMLEYGSLNSEITILEGILDVEFYKPLFEMAIKEYKCNIFAFYYDLPFEETLLRHNTKPNRGDFGEADMRRWWKANDYIGIILERIISKDDSLEETVDLIYDLVTKSDKSIEASCQIEEACLH